VQNSTGRHDVGISRGIKKAFTVPGSLTERISHGLVCWAESDKICFLAQVNNEADGLAEFSETWSNSGMMRNGRTYRRQPWALPIAENASGLLPTPMASDWKRSPQKIHYAMKPLREGTADTLNQWLQRESGLPHVRMVSALWGWMMGFPKDWTKLKPSETQ
jgi:hypothetical protein